MTAMPGLTRKQMALAILALWIATFAAYSNSFNNAFQFDDTHTVQSNMYIRDLRYIPRYFIDANTTSYRPENSGYRPMTTLALAIGFAISHIDTWGYHLIKTIEQALVATLLLLVAIRLLPQAGPTAGHRFWIAWFSALVFAVHRANTETVNYICAISTLQAGLFDILAFYLYLRWRENKANKNYLFWLSVLSFELGCMSKEEAITLPAMIALYEWVYLRDDGKPFRERFRTHFWDIAQVLLPYVMAALLFVVLRVTLPDPVADTSRGQTPTFIYAITQIRSWLHYWTLFFWPVELNADNLSFDFSQGLDDVRIWGAAAVHATVWAIAWRFRKANRFATFAVVWVYVTVLPASSVFRLVEAVNEHRMYIPYLMLAPLSVWLLFGTFLRAGMNFVVPAGVAALCVALLGAGTYERNKVWASDISLWEDVYSKNPSSPRAMNVLGVSLLNRGDFDRSVRLLEQCHQIVPNYLPCVVHLSIAYAHFKDYDRGLRALLGALAVDPNYVHVNFHLGLYYKDYFGDLVRGREYLAHAHELSSGRFFQATLKLAEIEFAQGRVAEGIRLSRSVLDIDKTNGDAWEAYAKGMLLAGDVRGAGQIFEHLVREFRDSWRYQLLFGGYSERKGDYRSANEAYRKAVEGFPKLIQGWMGIARVAVRLQDKRLIEEAEARVAVLKKNREWEFLPGLFLPSERANQIAPE